MALVSTLRAIYQADDVTPEVLQRPHADHVTAASHNTHKVHQIRFLFHCSITFTSDKI